MTIAVNGIEWAAAASSDETLTRPPYSPDDYQILIAGGGHHVTGVASDVRTTELATGQEAQGFVSVEPATASEYDPLHVFWDGSDPHGVVLVSLDAGSTGLVSDWASERVGSVGAVYPTDTVSLPLSTEAGDRLVVLAFARNASTLPTLGTGDSPDYSAVVSGSSVAAWIITPGALGSVSVTMPAGRSGHYVAAVRVRAASTETGLVGGPTWQTATPIEQNETSDVTPAAGGGLDPVYAGVAGQRWWRYDATADGTIRADLLLSHHTLEPLSDYAQVVATNLSDGAYTDDVDYVDLTNVAYRVSAGQSYLIRALIYNTALVDPAAIDYVLRLGELREADVVQAQPFQTQGVVSTKTARGGWRFIHSGSHPHPGTQRDAVECSWKHARRRVPASAFWNEVCPALVQADFDVLVGEGGTCGWTYSVDADDTLVGGSAGFSVYMPYASMIPNFMVRGWNLLGEYVGDLGQYPANPSLEHVKAMFGDDVIAFDDPLYGIEQPFTVTSMDVIGSQDEDAAIGGVGAGTTKWAFDTGPFTDKMNTVAKGGFSRAITNAKWVPIDPNADEFEALGYNEQTDSDAVPKINATDPIPLTAADYSVGGYITKQNLEWRAEAQPRPFKVFRIPPPAGGHIRRPRLRHLNIAPGRGGENWRGTSLRRISSYQ